MKKFFVGWDWSLVLASLALSLFGLVVGSRLVPELFGQQLIYLILGWLAFFIFSQVDYRVWEKLASCLFGFALLLLLLPFVFGTLTRGALRWVELGPFRFQPSEIVKPFLLLFYARFFAGGPLKRKKILLGAGLLFLPLLLIFLQPDLGSSLLLALSWLGILLAAGLSWVWLAVGLASLALILPLCWRFLLQDYQQERILSFLHPLADPVGSGYNLIQAKLAVGSGLLFGRGLGRGTQSHLRFLPERHTDFIFASLGEELGFLGCLVVILLFALLLARILTIAQKSGNSFGWLFALGIFSLFFFQVFINVGMNLGLLPITGITLPLVSYGGSSYLATLVALGILQNISRLKKKPEAIIIGA